MSGNPTPRRKKRKKNECKDWPDVAKTVASTKGKINGTSINELLNWIQFQRTTPEKRRKNKKSGKN